jgi:hypothetical protein
LLAIERNDSGSAMRSAIHRSELWSPTCAGAAVVRKVMRARTENSAALFQATMR